MGSDMRIREVLAGYAPEKRFALAAMQDLQRAWGYLPREGLEAVAEHLDCSLGELYAMATFYKSLRLTPRGRHVIKLCDGTACHIRGSGTLLDSVARLLGVGPGETTGDGLFSLETVNCLGACAIAPVMMIDETFYGKLTAEGLAGILAGYREEGAGA